MVFDTTSLALVGLIFLWTGFVRTGLGFGGAAIGLPLMLLIGGSPVYWLPIIGIHLLFFSSLTLFKSIKKVDWRYLRHSLLWIIPPTLVGVAGLLSLPDQVVIVFIYSITIFYAITWIFNQKITSDKPWVDKLLLILGGYVAGTSLTGAPLIVAVYMRYVSKEYLRNTLFVLWFILVSIKMATFMLMGVVIDWSFSLALIPIAAIGHVVGIKAHQKIIENDQVFKKWVGSMLLLISSFGLLKVVLS
ncbi:sulfite exporter TauE/SafE family protein [Candidatus Thioglobus autotrophicus]|uniref:sulfite exporter TauE/SafE family protein n=1 Tax=Candidatus Thioglobus autotrophicus TaxID=1705394 RepID=UPI00299D4EC7|nr:sulfite exporter TauE/SafE family protein [Candidatus Thioglobus autotrophicus]WPE16654.1 sulfite exporter TauE/SafE family protein [Candidatus Thioglobus autotrophicus]WPE18213.1 sulfite exporter TauE/SafE family protein [Candidatus Thioglobus autotrophicus]